MGSDESHLNVSLIVRDKVTRPCPQTTTFWGQSATQDYIRLAGRDKQLTHNTLTIDPLKLQALVHVTTSFLGGGGRKAMSAWPLTLSVNFYRKRLVAYTGRRRQCQFHFPLRFSAFCFRNCDLSQDTVVSDWLCPSKWTRHKTAYTAALPDVTEKSFCWKLWQQATVSVWGIVTAGYSIDMGHCDSRLQYRYGVLWQQATVSVWGIVTAGYSIGMGYCDSRLQYRYGVLWQQATVSVWGTVSAGYSSGMGTVTAGYSSVMGTVTAGYSSVMGMVTASYSSVMGTVTGGYSSVMGTVTAGYSSGMGYCDSRLQ